MLCVSGCDHKLCCSLVEAREWIGRLWLIMFCLRVIGCSTSFHLFEFQKLSKYLLSGLQYFQSFSSLAVRRNLSALCGLFSPDTKYNVVAIKRQLALIHHQTIVNSASTPPTDIHPQAAGTNNPDEHSNN